MSSKLLVNLLIVGLFPSSVAFAAPDVVGADIVATGGASQAASRSNAAVTTNPGLLGLHNRYDFAAQFGYGPNGGTHWGVSGMDGKTSRDVAFGFVYSGDRYEPPLTTDELPGWAEPDAYIPNMKRSHDFAAGLAYGLAEDHISIGVGGHVTLYNHDRYGQGTTGNVDVGVGFHPVEVLTIGLSANNLIPIDLLDDRPLRVAGGLRLDGPLAAIEVDGGWIHSDVGIPAMVAGGGELRPGVARIRAGARWEGPTAQSTITAGLGIQSEGGALEYALEVPIGGSLGTTVHVIGIRFSAPAPLTPDTPI